MSNSDLQRLILAATTINTLCEQSQCATTYGLKLCGIRPTFHTQSIIDIIPSELAVLIAKPVQRQVYGIIENSLLEQQRLSIAFFERSTTQLVSVENLSGLSDSDTERWICQMAEASYARHVHKTKAALLRLAEQVHSTNKIVLLDHKSSTFSPISLAVLETAYNNTQILTQKETEIIAKTAGITYDQFQNKRNRKQNQTPRSTSQSGLLTSPPHPASTRRVVSALPRRARNAAQTLPVPQHTPSTSARPVRGLPNRNERPPSATSSEGTNSTSWSVVPNGGFTSPLDGVKSEGGPVVVYPVENQVGGSIDPALQYAGYQYAMGGQMSMSEETDMGMGMDGIKPILCDYTANVTSFSANDSSNSSYTSNQFAFPLQMPSFDITELSSLITGRVTAITNNPNATLVPSPTFTSPSTSTPLDPSPSSSTDHLFVEGMTNLSGNEFDSFSAELFGSFLNDDEVALARMLEGMSEFGGMGGGVGGELDIFSAFEVEQGMKLEDGEGAISAGPIGISITPSFDTNETTSVSTGSGSARSSMFIRDLHTPVLSADGYSTNGSVGGEHGWIGDRGYEVGLSGLTGAMEGQDKGEGKEMDVNIGMGMGMGMGCGSESAWNGVGGEGMGMGMGMDVDDGMSGMQWAQ